MKDTTIVFLLRENPETADREILLAMKKRGSGEGKWNGVGGKLEEGESWEEGMIRETQEEIFVTPIKYLEIGDLRFTKAEVHSKVYLVYEWDGEPTESEEMRPQWFNENEIPYDEMWENDATWLPKILAGNYVAAEIGPNADGVSGVRMELVVLESRLF